MHPLNINIVRLYTSFTSNSVEVKINYMTWQRKFMLKFLTNISLNWFGLTFIKSEVNLYYIAYALSVAIVAFIFVNADVLYVFITFLYGLAIHHF